MPVYKGSVKAKPGVFEKLHLEVAISTWRGRDTSRGLSRQCAALPNPKLLSKMDIPPPVLKYWQVPQVCVCGGGGGAGRKVR